MIIKHVLVKNNKIQWEATRLYSRFRDCWRTAVDILPETVCIAQQLEIQPSQMSKQNRNRWRFLLGGSQSSVVQDSGEKKKNQHPPCRYQIVRCRTQWPLRGNRYNIIDIIFFIVDEGFSMEPTNPNCQKKLTLGRLTFTSKSFWAL